MRQNPKSLLLFGILLALAGFALDFGAGGEAQATAQQEQACRAEMTGRGPETAELADKCSKANFAIATIASGSAANAEDTAALIAQNNRTEVGGSMLSKFLMGLGLGVIIAGIIGLAAGKRRN